MNATILRMISTNSLMAFSAATTAAASPSAPIRLVRQPEMRAESDRPQAPLPAEAPRGPTPRGSLLDLRV
jgi:hypothetical protein